MKLFSLLQLGHSSLEIVGLILPDICMHMDMFVFRHVLELMSVWAVASLILFINGQSDAHRQDWCYLATLCSDCDQMVSFYHYTLHNIICLSHIPDSVPSHLCLILSCPWNMLVSCMQKPTRQRHQFFWKGEKLVNPQSDNDKWFTLAGTLH